MGFSFSFGLIQPAAFSHSRRKYLAGVASLFVGRVDPQGGARLGFPPRDPRGVAARVKLGAVGSAEDGNE
jgi:hypothetical protein